MARRRAVRISSFPDWYFDRLATGGTYVNQFPIPSPVQFPTIALFNDTGDGSSLHVFRISASFDGSNAMFLQLVQGAVGSFHNKCMPINPNSGSLPGSIYTQLTAGVAGNPPQTPPSGPHTIMGNGFVVSNLATESPLFILPPGYSLRMDGDVASPDAGAGFWYVVAPG